MKIIIDTNIVISSALKDGIPEQVILLILANPEKYQWFVSPEILTEYREVIKRKKFNLSEFTQKRWLRLIDTFTTIVKVNIVVDFPRAHRRCAYGVRKDAKFLACAIASEADFLITGDRDFQEASPLLQTRIITVSDFYTLMMDYPR